MIIKKSELIKGLPKTTDSLCPECKKIIKAKIFEENGKVMIEKECKEHGSFKDVYWSDVEMYLRAEEWAFDGVGIENPKIKDATDCPNQCGLCNLHLSHTCLANVDLTNRCNLKCPICFANANAAGYVYEPSFEQIVDMLKILRDERPVACTAVQFAGGEPTIYPKFFDVIKAAKKLGFSQIQVATNGIKFADDPNFAQKCEDFGLHTVYLQFDGLREDIYIKARGRPLMDVKQRAIDNCRSANPMPLTVVLVPTILNGINDDQVGPILDYAIENRDVIRAVNYQPVSFTGRISQEEREEGRFTLPDLADRFEKQTTYLKKEDFYPVPCVTPISELISVITKDPKVAFTCHPHCGIATYIFVDDGNVIPITRFIDVDGMLKEMENLAMKASTTLGQFALKLGSAIKSKKGKEKSLLKIFDKYFGKYINEEKTPKNLDIRSILTNVLSTEDKSALAEFSWDAIMVGGMHFQDSYNYDIERVKRCVIHYATPDGRIIPFCAYNGGPTYREEVEKKFSVPLDEWKKGKRKED
jgi:uncharacterized radical SAM superfamily Fe-S cluster-containing enzyme